MSELSEMFQDVVRKHGDMVDIGTARCVLWEADHENCTECESELGCCKAVGMMLISMRSMAYTPQGYEDYERMQKAIKRDLDILLYAKPVEEAKSIPF